MKYMAIVSFRAYRLVNRQVHKRKHCKSLPIRTSMRRVKGYNISEFVSFVCQGPPLQEENPEDQSRQTEASDPGAGGSAVIDP